MEESLALDNSYDILSNDLKEMDLSKVKPLKDIEKTKDADAYNSDAELENLAELVPDLKARRCQTNGSEENEVDNTGMDEGKDFFLNSEELNINFDGDGAEVEMQSSEKKSNQPRKFSIISADTTGGRRYSNGSEKVSYEQPYKVDTTESLLVQESKDIDEKRPLALAPKNAASGIKKIKEEEETTGHYNDDTSLGDDYPGSDHALEDTQEEAKVPKEFLNIASSGQSISTATQTHGEVRMPMYLPTFKPATGCTNASDFIVRCFVARLRSGITVVKHGRHRWCKSRLRVLHIHQDGRSLSWKPAEGEPTSSKRPPKLDLSTCLEVRHAWSSDPQNAMYTGTPILRQKCEAANAHKSFALIFKNRTVDITAVTADQCKVLMEGFSALCFRLQVANLAARGARKGLARPMPEDDGVSTTASVTLTNTSTPKGR